MSQHLWYVRKDGAVIGPFPAQQLQQSLTLGEFGPDQAVSLDGHNWLRLVDALQPATATATDSHRPPAGGDAAWQAERDKARLRWLNDSLDIGPPTVPGREEAATAALRRDEAATRDLIAREVSRKPRIVAGLIALLAIVLLTMAVWFGQEDEAIRTSLQGKVSNCALPAAEGVSWAGCVKAEMQLRGASLRNANLSGVVFDGSSLAGADLSYANLNGASLRGVDLRGVRLLGASLTGADLAEADLGNADLSFAILQGARLDAARLDGVRLHRATWIDGRTCAEGSVGACR